MIGEKMKNRELLIRDIYDLSGREYHNWAHITNMLNLLKNDFSYLSPVNMEKLRIAILYHDAIYNPGATDNEERSANLYKTFETVTYHPETEDNEKPKLISKIKLEQVPGLTNPASEVYDSDIVDLIMATKNHKVSENHRPGTVMHELSKIIIDLDLYGLGDKWDTYRAVTLRIKKEFMSAGIPEASFNAGRAAFIKKFLDRDSIFLTDFYNDRELRAIYNLKKELYILTTGANLG